MLQLVFVDLLNKKLYVTQNEGITFVEVSAPFSPDRLLFHPNYKAENRILGYANDERTVSLHNLY